MASTATAKNTGLSVKRVRPIVDLVRGMYVDEALHTLEFLPSPAAAVIAKVVRSANANAENELVSGVGDLKIVSIYANEGTSTKRFRARARGRSARIIRRNSHITVVVDEDEGEDLVGA
jgi:large subunit ribosomal protein L22